MLLNYMESIICYFCKHCEQDYYSRAEFLKHTHEVMVTNPIIHDVKLSKSRDDKVNINSDNIDNRIIPFNQSHSSEDKSLTIKDVNDDNGNDNIEKQNPDVQFQIHQRILESHSSEDKSLSIKDFNDDNGNGSNEKQNPDVKFQIHQRILEENQLNNINEKFTVVNSEQKEDQRNKLNCDTNVSNVNKFQQEKNILKIEVSNELDLNILRKSTYVPNINNSLQNNVFIVPKPDILKTNCSVDVIQKYYSCQHCEKQFHRNITLQLHLRSHTGRKVFDCRKCKKGFLFKSDLNTHLRIHTGERPFICPHCSKTFSQLGQLKSHIRIHTGEKPYKCDYCKISFSHLTTLKTHVLKHTGEKPHFCPQCPQTFRQISNLNIHLRTIHTKPYKCKSHKRIQYS